MSIIAINFNGMDTPIKWQRLLDCFFKKKAKPSYMLFASDTFCI